MQDALPTQIVGYMNTIHLPRTRLDVVNETLKRSLKVAKECVQNKIAVTYQLAIAKPAIQIQEAEAPKYPISSLCCSGVLVGRVWRRHSISGVRGAGIHTMLALAFKAFYQNTQFNTDFLSDKMNQLLSASPQHAKLVPAELGFKEYAEYTEQSRNGMYSATAVFWIQYIDLVELYLLFSSSCRTND